MIKIDIVQADGTELPAFRNAIRSLPNQDHREYPPDWHVEYIVKEFLTRFGADLYHEDYRFKHLIFSDDRQATLFLVKWSS